MSSWPNFTNPVLSRGIPLLLLAAVLSQPLSATVISKTEDASHLPYKLTSDKVPRTRTPVLPPARNITEKGLESWVRTLIGQPECEPRVVPSLTFRPGEKVFITYRVWCHGYPVQDASINVHLIAGRVYQVFKSGFQLPLQVPPRTVLRPVSQERVHRWFAARIMLESPAAENTLFFRINPSNPKVLVAIQQFQAQSPDGPLTIQWDLVNDTPFTLLPSYLLQGQATAATIGRAPEFNVLNEPLPFLTVDAEGEAITTDSFGYLQGLRASMPLTDQLSGPYVAVSSYRDDPPRFGGFREKDFWNLSFEITNPEEIYDNSELAQTTAFVEVNKIAAAARAVLPDVPWLFQQLMVKTEFPVTCNASFDGEKLVFFTGNDQCRNTGLLPDVIRHEWGHGLDHATGGIQDRSFSEAFGDIMAMIGAGTAAMGPGFFLDNDLRPIRNLDGDYRYPDDRSPSPHTEGLILGSTFWDLYLLLREKYGLQSAKNLISAFAFGMIATTEKYTDAYPTLLTLDEDNNEPRDFSPNYCLIQQAFAQHGLATKDPACDLGRVEWLVLDADHNGRFDPGEKLQLIPTLINGRDEALQEITATLSTPTGFFTIENDQVHWQIVHAFERLQGPTSWLGAVDQDAPCGELLSLTIETTNGTGYHAFQTKNLRLGKYVGRTLTETPGQLPIELADNNLTTIDIPIAETIAKNGVSLLDLKGALQIAHPFPLDIRAWLVAPDGTTLDLYTPRPDDFTIDLAFHFEEAKVQNIPVAGLWQLVIEDSNPGDFGTLVKFLLQLQTDEFQCEDRGNKADLGGFSQP